MSSIDWSAVEPAHVMQAVQEYDRVGADDFLARRGFGPTTTYDLVVGDRRYPPKAILGAAYQIAIGNRLNSGDFEGGRAGAVRVLTRLGFDVERRSDHEMGTSGDRSAGS